MSAVPPALTLVAIGAGSRTVRPPARACTVMAPEEAKEDQVML